MWQRLTIEKLGDGGLSYLITWPGQQPELLPALFISHVDVEPISPGTEQDWTYPPFSGTVAEGYIWGEHMRAALHRLHVCWTAKVAGTLDSPCLFVLGALGTSKHLTGWPKQ